MVALKALILSEEDELIKNIGNIFKEKIIVERSWDKCRDDYDIFVFDNINEAEATDIIKNSNVNNACVININSNYTLKNHNNFKKPFRLLEMLKRIENFINSCEKNIIYLNNLGKFNHKNRFIVIDNNNISLTEKESDLIYFLYKNEQSDEEEILQNIWGRENNTDGRVLETITRNLRQKLKNLSIKKQLIVNNNGHYRLET